MFETIRAYECGKNGADSEHQEADPRASTHKSVAVFVSVAHRLTGDLNQIFILYPQR